VAAKSFTKTAEAPIALGRDLVVEQTDTAAAIDKKVADYFAAEDAQVVAAPGYVPVDWVWLGNTQGTSMLMARSIAAACAAAPGKSACGVKMIANNWAFNETLANDEASGGCSVSCVDKYFGILPFKPYGDSTAGGMSALVATHDAYRLQDGADPSAYKLVQYVQGYVAAMLWRRGVERALDSGAKVIDGEALKAALETFKSVDMEGLTAGKISFSPTDHRPQSGELLFTMDATGHFVSSGDNPAFPLLPDWLGW
jgi:branched-chain amino acid transport system substrate-binding protein